MDLNNRLVILNSEAILNSIADGVVAIGLDHKIIFVNRAARELLGRLGDDMICGETCSKAIGHSACSLGCLITSTIKTGKHIYNHEAILESKGRRIVLSINTALLKDEKGEVIGGIEIFRDISLISELKNEIKGRYSFANIIGKNIKMHEVYELLHEVAPTRASVLIEGESGTGKELIASAIHHNSPRAGRPFIKLNCAALSEGVLESELFGHVKGAFTGAVSDKSGRFELADGGTLFLDEIGDMTLHTQVKLLRVLQEGEFERVGGLKTIRVDVRIIAATNKDLKDEVEKGNFREDLYYRLKVVPIVLPPLRKRKDDIPLLADHFMTKFNREMGRYISGLSPKALDLMLEYQYPGNIRELEHILEYAFVRCRGEMILPEHLPQELQNINLIYKAIERDRPFKELERATIIHALDETGWRYQTCANRLKISRTTLWRKMKALKIEKK